MRELALALKAASMECGGLPPLSKPGQAPEDQSGSELPHSTEFEERWTGGYIFENGVVLDMVNGLMV